MADPFYTFEVEHIFADSIFNDPARAAALRAAGYTADMAGNKISLYSNADVVAQLLDAPETNAFRQALIRAGWGPVRHDGSDNAAGGKQQGKNAFEADLIDEWIERMNLPEGDPARITQEAFRYSLDQLHEFNLKLAQGEILGADGRPLGVMGDAAFATELTNAWESRYPGFDPSVFNDPANPAAAELRSHLDAYKAGLDTTTVTNAAERGRSALRLAQEMRASDLITAEQYNKVLRTIGTGTDGARVRNGILELSTYSASKAKVWIGDNAAFTAEAVAQGRAAAILGEENPRGTLSEFEARAVEMRAQYIQEQALKANLKGNLLEYGRDVAEFMHRSAATIATSRFAYRANMAGMGIGYVDSVYDAVKKGISDGDWSEYWIETAKFGAIATASFAGIAVVTGLVAGTAAAPFVAAGLAIVGIVGAGYALYDLMGKVATDLGLIDAPKQDGAIPNSIQENLLFLNNVGEKIIYNQIMGRIGFPVVSTLGLPYVADTQDVNLPGTVHGALDAPAPELFYGRNGAKIYGEGGTDEIYHSGYGEAHGGDGSDVVVGNRGTVLHAGEKLYPWMDDLARERTQENARIQSENAERASLGLPLLELLPELPNSPTADEDKYLLLDGGADNDIVIALRGGERVTTIGGAGRDWVFNTSNKGILYGDTVDGLIPGEFVPVEDSSEFADNFWFWHDVEIEDAQHYDVLKFFGIPMTGGDASASSVMLALGARFGGLMVAGGLLGAGNAAAIATGNKVYFDYLMPFMTYARDGNDLLVANVFDGLFAAVTGQSGLFDSILDADGERRDITGVMRIKNFDFKSSIWGFDAFRLGNIPGQTGMPPGTMNMVFKDGNPLWAAIGLLSWLLPGGIGFLLQALSALDAALAVAGAALRAAKAMKWSSGADPLIIDLDGDGIETISMDRSKVYFDIDGDLFAEKTGWVKGDDGFLVVDNNHNGQIDDVSEMFGNRFEGGYQELASYDSNSDGKISLADAVWSELRVWRDRNQNGLTDAGELKSLDELGIAELSLGTTAININTPQGTRLLSGSDIIFADGTVRHMFEAIFTSSDVDTHYAGESGRAAWQQDLQINSKGFGNIADLAVAMANDVDLGDLAATTAAAMTTANLKTLVQQVGDVLGHWGMTLDQSRELTPVLLGTDAGGKTVLVDRGIYVEDSAGGYWTLASGSPINDPVTGQPIARATFEDVLRQVVSSGQHWQVEQSWSPVSRGTEVQFRDDAPYLMHIVDGRAIIDDWGVQNPDGSWRLFSGQPILASDGLPIAFPTVDDILHMPHPEGQEWRVEALGFNPLANLPVDTIGVRFTDGVAVDYTVQVTDQDGTFYVWARNLDRALELEAKTGDSRGFNLRNYEIDFDSLDEVGSTDDSVYRVELLTPAQFNFALSLSSIEFHPEMLTAVLNNQTGHLAYSVNSTGETSLSPDHYDSPITPMIQLLDQAMQQYVITSRRLAVRLALQGGLSAFAQGITYDAAADKYRAVGGRELAPMFEAIFAGAPDNNDNDAAFDYLTGWNELLWQIYPDYAPNSQGNMWGSTVAVDQAYIFQMMLPAFESMPIPGLSIEAAAHALSIDETRIITHTATQSVVHGRPGSD
ncbi:MAG TPA: hypothetical protein VF079_10670, partial [Sphingomicrobium sp.]